MQRQVSPLELLFMAQAQAMHRLDQAIHGKAPEQCHQHTCQAAQQLADQTDAT
ncbi:hypothetical protein D3C80_2220790 [compost metagenome]